MDNPLLKNNPLLNYNGLPAFSNILPEHVEPAIKAILEENKKGLETRLAQSEPFTWENLIEPNELAEEHLARSWSPVQHLISVANSKSLRKVYNQCLPKLSEYYSSLQQNQALFEAYQSLSTSDQFHTWSPAQQKVLTNYLRDFQLGGIHLTTDKKQRFRDISKKLSELSAKFGENVLDATNAWSLHILDINQLKGLPDDSVEHAAKEANLKNLQGWIITLQYPVYHAVITYAEDPELRELVYQARSTLASDCTNHPEWDNSKIIEDILSLRHESAQLLGFKNYAELSLSKKMAESSDEVLSFLYGLVEQSNEKTKQEYAQMSKFASNHFHLENLQAWDIAYVSEKLKSNDYQLSEEQLKPWFSVEKVIAGLFELVSKLFSVDFVRREQVDTWHSDVQFYDIQNTSGETIAGFYFDLFARKNKNSGAWASKLQTRQRSGEHIQTPVSHMVCNFSPATADKPALMTHDEVITLFHEFGHGLHHLLTDIEYREIAGNNGVEWDAVELPSQWLENWCWEKSVLDLFSKHVETGEPLPNNLFEKLLDSRNFQAGMKLVRQLEFAIFDMRIHSETGSRSIHQIMTTLNDIRQQLAGIQVPDNNRFPHSFSHIFNGGYAAGYYSYKWAEILSLDAFDRFKEDGLFSPAVSQSFLKNILSVGGSRSAMESFKAFRGREPNINALLKHSGLLAN